MDPFFETNRSLWNQWTRIHEKSAFYDVASFRAGGSTLNPIELRELGDVSGKSLLHLQCHFGLDTLSWARLGARVTGVDLSDAAIDLACSLGRETGLDATFVCSNLYDLPDVLSDRFDVVFTSYGVLGWLPDLPRWARLVSHSLKPGGVFYMVEFHPLAYMLDEEGIRLRHPYFGTVEPERYQERGSYADPTAEFAHPSYQWNHTLSDVLNAVIAAGLRIEFVHEFPYSAYGCFPFVEEREPGQWWPKQASGVPLMFSVRANR